MLVAQLCPTLWDPMDYSPPGSSVHEIFHTKTLEWVVISFSRGSSQPRDQTQVSCIAGRFFTSWATREAQEYLSVASSFSSGSFRLRNWTRVSCIAGDSLIAEPLGKPKNTGLSYPFSRETSQSRNWTRVSCMAGRFFTSWGTREALSLLMIWISISL